VKVESWHRPDGARRGPRGFYDLLNAGKRSVALDLTELDGVEQLRQLLHQADVVVEASRPRALRQLGIVPDEVAAAGRLRVWLSITAFGRDAATELRVGFGDDAAAAGGLVAWDPQGPVFCADAAADPATGLVAAVAALDRFEHRGAWLVDVHLAGVAAHLAGRPGLPANACWTGPVAPPRSRPANGRAADLGQHTDEVLAALVGR
jgi:crotonobetainyl-CoA:carnitine CoA-transferase CaiB-like acyl-CoA transferase